jgi:hypothetical protein
MIPIMNIILLFVWAFSEKTKVKEASLQNYARATLIWMAIASLIAVLAMIIISAVGASMVNNQLNV